MKILIAGAALVVLVTAAAPVVTPAPVVAAERAFAKDGGAMGVNPSFVKWSTDEAIVIGGGGVGKAHVDFAGPAPAGPQPVLAWWPLYAGMAQSGDFGFTTGPVEVGGKRQGHYFTVWKRQADGGWKWVYDGGTGATAVGEAPASVEPVYLPIATVKPITAQKAMDQVKAAEAAFAGAAAKDQKAAFASVLIDDARVYVAPRPPAVGKAGAVDALSAYPAVITFGAVSGGEASKAGDMAYTYGPVTWGATKGIYVHLWQRRADGWKLAFAQIIPQRAG